MLALAPNAPESTNRHQQVSVDRPGRFRSDPLTRDPSAPAPDRSERRAGVPAPATPSTKL